MENPEVTIVIPTINRPLKVIEAIKSIDNQTFKGNIFCTIVDSSDNDETKKLIDQYKTKKNNLKIKYIHNSESKRPIDNWIIGIEEFKTEYGKFLCDDDWLNEEFLEKTINKMDENKVDSVMTNIKVIKENGKDYPGYYKFESGLTNKKNIINSFLGIENILPVTPTANLMKSKVLKESFFESLKHINCTKYLFGFDFFISYFSAFNGNGTFLLNEDLSYSFAGNDSMTLNVKKAKISYCYFFALINLIESSNFSLNNQQKSLVQHKIATFRLKMLISKEYKEFWLENTFTPRLDIKKLIFSQFKKYYIKLNYFLKDSTSKNIS